MSRANAVYNYSRTLERELKKLHSNYLGKENSIIVLKFHRQLVAEGIGIARRIKYLQMLRYISSLLNKPFSTVTKDDIIDFVAKIEQLDYSDWTKRDYKMILKRFYKWLRNCEYEYPLEVRWIRIKNNIPSKLQKKDLLTVNEIESIANCARHIRDKAFIWVLFGSMRRLGEILTLNIGDVEFDELGVRLRVHGKMGTDYGRVIVSTSLLSNWLNIHPLRDNPDAPLWVTLGSQENIKQLTYSGVRAMLQNCAKRAGIKKRVWLYLFRHSRITPASKILPHALLCSTAGWKQGSRMPSVYIHLGGEDVDEAHCILSGIPKVNKKEEEILAPMKCKRCKADNTPGSKFCNKCGSPLSSKIAMELDDARKKADSIMSELITRPKVMEVLLNALVDLKD